MPMRRELYADDWEQIALRVKEEVDWRCEECGKQCRRPGEPFDTHKRTLTVSHQDHNPANCERSNLKALCAPCHLRYDEAYHVVSYHFGEYLGDERPSEELMAYGIQMVSKALFEAHDRWKMRKVSDG